MPKKKKHKTFYKKYFWTIVGKMKRNLFHTNDNKMKTVFIIETLMIHQDLATFTLIINQRKL